jgi:hypothetical protein
MQTLKGYRAHTVRDQMRFLANPARLQRPAFAVISKLQDFTPGEQILGAGVALIAMCQSTGMSLQEVLTISARVMADTEGPFTSHIQAVRDYARHEIAGGEEYRQ